MDREFAVLFDVFNENDNWFLDENIRTYLTEVPGSLDELKSSFDFWVSNLKGTINGLVSGNVEGLRMYKNEKVVWYLLHIGGNTEMHTVHFHGQSMLYVSNRPVTRILCGGVLTEAKVDQTTKKCIFIV